MAVPLLHYEHQNRVTPRLGLSHASIYPYCAYNCRDGQIVIAIQNPDEWRRFCLTVLEQPELTEDPLFYDNPSRVANKQELDVIINAVFSSLTREQIINRSIQAQTAYGNVSTIEDLAKHPALKRISVELPDGAFECVAPPLHPDLNSGPVPALGQHTEQVIREFST